MRHRLTSCAWICCGNLFYTTVVSLLSLFVFVLELNGLKFAHLKLRKDFPKEQFLQVFVGPFFGLFTDLGMSIFAFVNPNFYAVKIFTLFIGCILLALGIYLQVTANVIVNPGEGVVKIIANKTGKQFGIIKIIFDSTLLLIAAVISLFAFGTIKGIREGTIISAILVGYLTKIFGSIFTHFNEYFKNKDLFSRKKQSTSSHI